MVSFVRVSAAAAILLCGLSFPLAPAWSAGAGGGGGGGAGGGAGGGGGSPGPTLPSSSSPEQGSTISRTTPERSPSAPDSPTERESRLHQGEQATQPGADSH